MFKVGKVGVTELWPLPPPLLFTSLSDLGIVTLLSSVSEDLMNKPRICINSSLAIA